MKNLLFVLILLTITTGFSQDIEEEFLPIEVEGKEAFMSTKTGEYVFKSHADTNPEELTTTPSGVVYNDITYHTVVQGETLSSISKKHDIGVDQIVQDNKLSNNALSLGQKIKLVKRTLVPSSSPVISYVGEERIIARLPVGESPATLPPPPVPTQNNNLAKPAPKKNNYSKPNIVPLVVEEDVIVQEEDSAEVIAAKKQLEEAKRQLELAKQKAVLKEEAKAKLEETKSVLEEEDIVTKKVNTKLETEKDVLEEEVEANTKTEVTEDKSETASDKADKTPEYHVVVKGDNLYSLSKKYNTTVEKLSKLNDIKFNNLKIGQKLKLK